MSEARLLRKLAPIWLFAVQAAAHPAEWAHDDVKVKVNASQFRT